ARWRTPRILRLLPTSPQKTLARLLKKLRPHHAVEPSEAGFILPTKTLALAAGTHRLYELHFPRQSPEWRTVAQHFLDNLTPPPPAPRWPLARIRHPPPLPYRHPPMAPPYRPRHHPHPSTPPQPNPLDSHYQKS